MDLLWRIQNLGQDVFSEDVWEKRWSCRVSPRGIYVQPAFTSFHPWWNLIKKLLTSSLTLDLPVSCGEIQWQKAGPRQRQRAVLCCLWVAGSFYSRNQTGEFSETFFPHQNWSVQICVSECNTGFLTDCDCKSLELCSHPLWRLHGSFQGC